MQDPATVRETAINWLTEGLMDWFALDDPSSERGAADWVLSYTCAVDILESKDEYYLIAGHHQGIALGILAFWSESPRRAGLRAET